MVQEARNDSRAVDRILAVAQGSLVYSSNALKELALSTRRDENGAVEQ